MIAYTWSTPPVKAQVSTFRKKGSLLPTEHKVVIGFTISVIESNDQANAPYKNRQPADTHGEQIQSSSSVLTHGWVTLARGTRPGQQSAPGVG